MAFPAIQAPFPQPYQPAPNHPPTIKGGEDAADEMEETERDAEDAAAGEVVGDKHQ